MSEWLTTGQMIDRLKVGETAESDCGMKIFNNKGQIEHLDHPTGTMVLYARIKNAKWRILPTYVSFEEAMKEYKNGKTIALHEKGRKAVFNRDFAYDLGGYDLVEIAEGKWSIEK